jgi:dTDP-4-amino-4,6-dideoxygalactose transaminase
VPYVAPYSTHVYHQYTLQLHNVNRDALSAYLAEKKIPSMIYYPVPGHRQKMFSGFDLPPVDLTITDWLTERVISLPIHTEMEQEQLDFICSTVANFLTH